MSDDKQFQASAVEQGAATTTQMTDAVIAALGR